MASGGLYSGDGTICQDVICESFATGACCLFDGTCVEVSVDECSALGGMYLGDDVPCLDVNCGTATKESTWGRIKADYR
jgi:hypothetical protein